MRSDLYTKYFCKYKVINSAEHNVVNLEVYLLRRGFLRAIRKDFDPFLDQLLGASKQQAVANVGHQPILKLCGLP
jgi:hypothetical protein